MAVITVGIGGTRTISQSGSDDVAFLGAGTLNVAGTAASPINVVLSSVGGIGLLDTINITNANVTVAGVAGVSALTTYNVGDGGTLTFSNTAQISVGSTVNFTSPNGHLVLGNGANVSALNGISGFLPGDTLSLPAAVANVDYNDNPGLNTGGQLILLDGNGKPITTIQLLTGDFTQQSFTPTTNGNGGTTVTNTSANAGATPAGSATQPLYRFFDSKTGTQFLTANPSERAALINPTGPGYRPDLVPETNSFGAVDPAAADPAKIQVFRFFDSTYGTHFFTSSQSEATAISTPGSSGYRSDLVAEPAATFYEHGTQQSGDVAVYRLFDKVHGTHFYTGSAQELAGITTAGTSTYRADLVNEGVAFYAPSGSFA